VGQDCILRAGLEPAQGLLEIGPQVENLPHTEIAGEQRYVE
jgi:hypothetical protein